MERGKNFLAFLVDVTKLVGMVATVFGGCYGAARLYAYASTRASASEVAVIKSNQDRDHELWMYIANRVGAIGDQMNNLAIHGRVNYVEPPIPPAHQQVLGPEPAPIKVTP